MEKEKKTSVEPPPKPKKRPPTLDLSQPQFDQTFFKGRVLHYIKVCNPLNMFLSDKDLAAAKKTLDNFKVESKKPWFETPSLEESELLWKAKYQYESAFDPNTGIKRAVIQRMPAYLPIKILLLSGMLTFYKTKPAIIFWQVMNQSFTTYVRATNCPNCPPISTRQWLTSYVAACGTAVFTALYLRSQHLKKCPKNSLLMRFVPFHAVCAAILIQIPIQRQHELVNGTPVYAEPTNKLVGYSNAAARNAVIISCIYRCAMHFPGLVIAPLLTHVAVFRGLFCYKPLLAIPFQTALVAMTTAIGAPLIYALFKEPAFSTMSMDSVEKTLRKTFEGKKHRPETVYYDTVL